MNVDRSLFLGCGLCLALSVSTPVLPADSGKAANLGALIDETQKSVPDSDRVTLAWWLPEEFWQWSLSQNPSLTEQGIEEFLDVLRPYTLLAVVDGTIGPLPLTPTRRRPALRSRPARCSPPGHCAGAC